MKVLIYLAILAAVVALLYLIPTLMEVGEPEQTEPADISALELEGGPMELELGEHQNTLPVEKELSLDERKQQIEVTQAKLATLMKTFDENLKKPQQRAEIKAKMDVLMKQYNELVLPVAIRKMKDHQGVEG